MITFPPYLIAIFIGIFTALSLPMSYLAIRSSGLKVSFNDALYLGAVQIFTSLFFSYIGNLVPVSLAAIISYISIAISVVAWIYLLRGITKDQYSGFRAAVAYLLYFTYSILAAILLAFITIPFFIQAYKISDNSMAPAFNKNDMVFFITSKKTPLNNQVVVFRTASGQEAIGRIKAQPGTTTTIEGGKVEIAGTIQNETTDSLKSNQYYVTEDNSSANIPPRVIQERDILGTVGSKF